MKKTKITREFIYKVVYSTLNNITGDRSHWHSKGFRIWLGREKRKKEKAEEITNLIRKSRASQSRNKVINVIENKLTEYYYEYKTNAKKTK